MASLPLPFSPLPSPLFRSLPSPFVSSLFVRIRIYIPTALAHCSIPKAVVILRSDDAIMGRALRMERNAAKCKANCAAVIRSLGQRKKRDRRCSRKQCWGGVLRFGSLAQSVSSKMLIVAGHVSTPACIQPRAFSQLHVAVVLLSLSPPIALAAPSSFDCIVLPNSLPLPVRRIPALLFIQNCRCFVVR